MKKIIYIYSFILLILSADSLAAQYNIEQNDAKKSTEAVGEFTGTLNVSIPLASVSAGKLNFPVGLSYISNGLKPNEASSGVGLGWILNEPAVIYKLQQGMEDTYRKLYNKPLQMGYPINDQDDYLDDTADGAYDIYTYNIFGYTGKIVFNPTTNECIQINKSDLVFSFSGGLDNFEVTLPDGSKFIFFRQSASIQTDDKDHPPIWRPTRIYSYDFKDTIRLEYTTGAYQYNTLVDDHFIKEDNFDSGTESHKLDYLEFPICLLNKVVGKNDSILIEYTNRLDVTSVPQWPFPNSKCSKIKYISDNVCLENILVSDYFEINGYKEQIRLKEIVTQKCNTPSEALPSYKFEYEGTITNGIQNVPSRTTRGIDKWGYFNGYESNPIYNMTPTTISGGGAIRSTITDKTKIGMLKNITYPNGGITSFEYQQNREYFKKCVTLKLGFNNFSN